MGDRRSRAPRPRNPSPRVLVNAAHYSPEAGVIQRPLSPFRLLPYDLQVIRETGARPRAWRRLEGGAAILGLTELPVRRLPATGRRKVVAQLAPDGPVRRVIRSRGGRSAPVGGDRPGAAQEAAEVSGAHQTAVWRSSST